MLHPNILKGEPKGEPEVAAPCGRIAMRTTLGYTPIDVLYIDGAHRYGPARADIRDWGARVTDGGTMLIHDSFSSIVTAVMEGRAIYDNIKKFILYAFSGITAEFFVVCFSLLPAKAQGVRAPKGLPKTREITCLRDQSSLAFKIF